MKPRLPDVDRRTLLIGGGAGVGLVVAFLAWPRRQAGLPANGQDERSFGAFLKIGRDGRVIVAIPQTETGQGVWTALPQVLADELGAAWESIAVEPAPASSIYANPLSRAVLDSPRELRITAGSTSVRGFYEPFRRAGAAARELLIAAAADRWNVDPGDCAAAGGMVTSGGRAARFAELADDAARMELPADVPQRSGSNNRLLGQLLPRLDLPPKSDGSFRFAGDVRLPEMLFASARMAPLGGRLTAYSRDGAEAVPGVRQVVARNSWLAVLADNWWQADQAVRAAEPRFEGRDGLSREGLRAVLDEALESGESDTWYSRGDYAAAVEGRRPLAATYWIAPVQHLGLEPLTATARITRGRVEVWAATQAPELARATAAEAAGAEVTLYPMPAGDGGGRALEADVVPIAVELARLADRPVQVTLPQHVTQNHGRSAPPALARMLALPGESGPTAWKMRIATTEGLGAALGRAADERESDRLGAWALDGSVPPYAIPNVSIDGIAVSLPIAPGYLRGHPQRTMVFTMESFVDELARAAGAEPLAFRMAMLGGNPRLGRCLSAAAAMAGWDGGGQGSTMGLAGASLFGSHIGLVANASLGADQRIQVHRLTAVVDCGRIVNPQLVRQQTESSLIWALGLATVREPEWVAGMPRSRPLGALGLPRLAGTPRIDVHLVDSKAAPGGVSGLAVAVLAPAVANAIAAGAGKRLRELPFDPMAVA